MFIRLAMASRWQDRPSLVTGRRRPWPDLATPWCPGRGGSGHPVHGVPVLELVGSTRETIRGEVDREGCDEEE